MHTDRYRAAERDLFQDAGIAPLERWLTLPDGVRVRVLEHGEGRPTLFLHGGPNAAATWAYVAAATTGTRCILVDRPGCGLSDPPRSVPDNNTVAAYVSRLTVDLLDALELPAASLVGSSFGGFSALRSAADHPGCVSRVVLAGCPAFVPGWTAPGFFTLLRAPLLGRLVPSLPSTPASVRMGLRMLGHHRALAEARVTAPMLAWIHAWERDTDTMRNDAAMIAACGTFLGGFDPALDLSPAELARIATPCLVLGGADDPVGGREVIEGLAAALPGGSSDCLAAAGHLPWLDDPAWFGERISAFVASA